MKTYLWKKKIEIKKSVFKCLLMITVPLITGGVYTKIFPLNPNWFYFMFPITISVLNYYITYNVDDIACASTYALVGIPQKTMWISNIIFCSVVGYVMSIGLELIAVVLKLVSFDGGAILLTFMSIPCAVSLLGLSTIHYLTNSKKQMLVASFFSIICLLLVPITVLTNVYLPIERLNMVVYGIITIIFIIVAIGMYIYMGQKDCLETLVRNSKIYIEGYDKNFFREE